MPAESSRLRRRPGPRDRRLIAAACAVAASAPAALVLGGHANRPPSCTSHERAGFMGAETVTACPAGDNRRKELTHPTSTFTLEPPMSRLTNAVSKPVFAFVARIRLR